MATKPKKFKVVEKNAKNAPVKDIQWEGEEIFTESQTKLTDDVGSGQAVVLRFFDFGVNMESFKKHKPTGQELFESHRRGIESILWRDGLKPFEEVQPRLMFAKNKKFYRFIIACIPRIGNVLADNPLTLSQLLNKSHT